MGYFFMDFRINAILCNKKQTSFEMSSDKIIQNDATVEEQL